MERIVSWHKKGTPFFKSRQLQRKISTKHKTITIGIMGVVSGVGTTHTGLMIANYFAHYKNQVACVEWGQQKAFSRIQAAYEGEGFNSEGKDSFRIKRVKYYKEFSMGSIGAIRKEGYQVIVVDLGIYDSKKIQLMNEFDIQIIVGFGSDWNTQDTLVLFESLSESQTKGWQIIIPMGAQSELQYIRRKTGRHVWSLPMHRDPFKWNKEIGVQLENILEI